MSAQHGRKSELPTNASMAEMLRAGEPIEDLAARLGVTVQRIQSRLNDAGWASDGRPTHTPPPSRTVLVVLDDQRWRDRALCAETDPEAFHPENGGSTVQAKAICGRCEVRPECLDYALSRNERFGIYGGLSERERRKLKKAAS